MDHLRHVPEYNEYLHTLEWCFRLPLYPISVNHRRRVPCRSRCHHPIAETTSFRSSSKAFAFEITLTETAQQQRTGWSQHHLPKCAFYTLPVLL